jgi:hypothetical protein
VGLVKPHVKNRLQGAVPFPLFAAVADVHLPGAELDWTVAPRFDLGYRLPEGLGEFLLSYRFLVSEGAGVISDYDFLGDGALTSRLDLNAFDLDYACSAVPLGPWDMKWRVGARLANIYFDSRAQGGFLGQRTSNHFIGAGPHVGLDLWRHLDLAGLGLFARVEGALAIGRVRQGFEETFLFDDGSMLGNAATVCQSQAIPTLNVQLGLSWAPSTTRSLRFSTGYQYEHWWGVGRAGDSRGELWDQGVFFRGEFDF